MNKILLHVVALVMCSALLSSQPKVTSSAVKFKQLPTSVLSADMYTISKKSAIQFKPIGVLNPATKTPTKGDSILVLPNGKRVKASEYYDELNKVEKDYNTLGYSVLDDASKPVLLQKSLVNAANLNKQLQQIVPVSTIKLDKKARSTRFNSTISAIDTKEGNSDDSKLGSKSKAATQINPNKAGNVTISGTLVMPQPKLVDNVKEFNYSFGDKSSFEAYLKGKLKTHGETYSSETSTANTRNFFALRAEGHAGCTILKKEFDILSAEADFEAPADPNKKLEAKFVVEVLGDAVYNIDEQVPQQWKKTDTFSKSAKAEVPFKVPLGPINVSGAVGITGSVGVEYEVTVNRSGVEGTVSPFVNVKGYGEAGVDLWICGGGVGASLTVADARMDLSASANLTYNNSSKKWQLKNEFNIGYELEFLSGRIYTYAFVYVPKWGLPPWTEKRFEHEFFDWSGYKKSGTLLDISKTTNFETW